MFVNWRRGCSDWKRKTDKGKKSYILRIIKQWRKLPREAVQFLSIGTFSLHWMKTLKRSLVVLLSEQQVELEPVDPNCKLIYPLTGIRTFFLWEPCGPNNELCECFVQDLFKCLNKICNPDPLQWPACLTVFCRLFTLCSRCSSPPKFWVLILNPF